MTQNVQHIYTKQKQPLIQKEKEKGKKKKRKGEK